MAEMQSDARKADLRVQRLLWCDDKSPQSTTSQLLEVTFTFSHLVHTQVVRENAKATCKNAKLTERPIDQFTFFR